MPTVAKDSEAEACNPKYGVEISSDDCDDKAVIESPEHDMLLNQNCNAAKLKNVTTSNSGALVDNINPKQERSSTTEDMAAGKEDKKKVLELMSLNFNSSADVEKAKELICETLAAKEKKATTRKSKKRRLEMLLEMDGSDLSAGKDASKYSLLKTNPITQALKRVRKEPLQSPPSITSPTSLVPTSSGFLSLTSTAAMFSSVSPKALSPSLRSLKSISSSGGLPAAGQVSTHLASQNSAAVIAAVSQSLAVASVPALKRVRRGSRRSGSDKDSSEETTSLSEASEAESKTEEDDGNEKKKAKIRIQKSLPLPDLNSLDQLMEKNNHSEESDRNLFEAAGEGPRKLPYGIKNGRGRGGRGRGKAAVDLILQGKSNSMELKPSSVSRMKARSRLSLPYITAAAKDTSVGILAAEARFSADADVRTVIATKPKVNRLSRLGKSLGGGKKTVPISRANQNKFDKVNVSSSSYGSAVGPIKANKNAKVPVNRKDESTKTNSQTDATTSEAKFARNSKNSNDNKNTNDSKKKPHKPLTVPKTKNWLKRQSELSKRNAASNTELDKLRDVESPATEAKNNEVAVDDENQSKTVKLVKPGRKPRLALAGTKLKQAGKDVPKLRRSRSSTPVNVSSLVTEGKLAKSKSTIKDTVDSQPILLETPTTNLLKMNEKSDCSNPGKDVQSTSNSKLKEDDNSSQNISDSILNEDSSVSSVTDGLAAGLDTEEDISGKKSGMKRKKKHFRGLKYSFSSAAEKRRKLARDARRAAVETSSDADTTLGTYSDKNAIEACSDLDTSKLVSDNESFRRNDPVDMDESSVSIKLSLDDSINDEANVNVIACLDENKDGEKLVEDDLETRNADVEDKVCTRKAEEHLKTKKDSIELTESDDNLHLTLKSTPDESLNDSMKLGTVIQSDIIVEAGEDKKEMISSDSKSVLSICTSTAQLPASNREFPTKKQQGKTSATIAEGSPLQLKNCKPSVTPAEGLLLQPKVCKPSATPAEHKDLPGASRDSNDSLKERTDGSDANVEKLLSIDPAVEQSSSVCFTEGLSDEMYGVTTSAADVPAYKTATTKVGITMPHLADGVTASVPAYKTATTKVGITMPHLSEGVTASVLAYKTATTKVGITMTHVAEGVLASVAGCPVVSVTASTATGEDDSSTVRLVDKDAVQTSEGSVVGVAVCASVCTPKERIREALEIPSSDTEVTKFNNVEKEITDDTTASIKENEKAPSGITEVVREIVNDVAISLQREVIQTAQSNRSYLENFSDNSKGNLDLYSSAKFTTAHVDSLSLSLNLLKSIPSEASVVFSNLKELPSIVDTRANPTKALSSKTAAQSISQAISSNLAQVAITSTLTAVMPGSPLIKDSDCVLSTASVGSDSDHVFARAQVAGGVAASDLKDQRSVPPSEASLAAIAVNMDANVTDSQELVTKPTHNSLMSKRRKSSSSTGGDGSQAPSVSSPSVCASPSSQPSVDFLRSLSLIRTEDAESVREEAIKKSVNRPKINMLSLTAAFNKKKKPVKLKRNNDLSRYEEKKHDNDHENPYTFVASPPKANQTVLPLRIRTSSGTAVVDSGKPNEGTEAPSMMRTTRRKAFTSSRRYQEEPNSTFNKSANDSCSSNLTDDTNNTDDALQPAKEDGHRNGSTDDDSALLSGRKGVHSNINFNATDNSATERDVKTNDSSNDNSSSLCDASEVSSNELSKTITPATYATEGSEAQSEEDGSDQAAHYMESASFGSNYKPLDSEEASTGEGDGAGMMESEPKDGVGSVIVDGGVRKSRRIGRLHVPSPTPQPLAIAAPTGWHDDKEHHCTELLADPSLAQVLCKCQERLSPQAALPGGPIYCQAIDSFEGRMLGCCNTVKKNMYLRVSGKIPFLLLCDIHRHRLRRHNCCPGCGLFCTQGVFMECRWSAQRHHYHKLCGVAAAEGGPLLCPHCGSGGPPAEVHLDIRLARKPVVYLEQHQERKASSGARMIWSKHESSSESPPHEGPELDLGEGRVVSPGKLAPSLDRDRLAAAIVSVSGGKPPNIKCTPKSLYWACKHGDLEKVLQVLCGGVDPNARVKDNNNQTGLHMAAIMGNVAIAHVLVMAGAALDLCDSTLCTPLMIAVQKHHNSMVHYLVAAGADLQIKTNEGMTSLHLAAKLGNLTACRHLLDSGRLSRHAINMQDEGGWTPLVWGSENRHISVVKFLLERGANPQLCDVEQNTALHWAALSGCTRICSMLLDRGCSPHSMNAYQDTPLHIAARQNHRDAVVLLLARGARLDCTNTKQQTPLQCAPPDSEVFLQLMLNTKLREVMDTKNHRTNTVLSSDIAAGKEQVPIPCINGIDNAELPRNYLYIAENTEAANINIDRSIGSLKWCCCSDGCTSGDCGCAQLNFRCWYDPEGRLLQDFNYIDPPMIFECNRACGCNKLSCNNRVVQHGITAHLQLFRTTSKGWGVRAMKRILKGSYVCEYVGEIITDLEADQRQDDSYLFDLDNRDSETFCLDARNYGNVARFINHLCAPNLTPVKVFLDHQDLAFPRIALYANRDIEAEEELGFDYGEKFWMVKYKQFTCTCGGDTCRYSVTTIQATLQRYNARLQEGTGPAEGLLE